MGPREILYIAYPVLPVSEESCGGAEQVLHTLERGMAAAGHRTSVVACEGSRIAGELLPSGCEPEENDRVESRRAEHREAALRAIAERQAAGRPFDLLHDHSGDFWESTAEIPAPVLITLHLPRYMYPQERFIDVPPNVFFNCVSDAQAAWYRGVPNLLGVVENGIRVERFPFSPEKRDYVLWLGRFCQEKGPQVAIEAARRAGLPLILAGQVYPFSYHEEFFSTSVAPQIDGEYVRLIERPTFAEKQELLRRARAVVIPSLVDETSSLVMIEAMACGTPVVAFRRGGLAEIVRNGETGFLVDTVDEIASALASVGQIEPALCRKHIEERYGAERMVRDYGQLYEQVLALSTGRARAAEADGVAAD